MISQSVIYAVLIGIVLTGVIPVIGMICLLAAGKIKGSSFWAGVLTYIIGFLVSSLTAALSTLPFSARIAEEPEFENTLSIIITILMLVILVISMTICINSCMKRTRSFKGGISCGLGSGIAYSVTAALGSIYSYSIFAMINSGEFDRQYMEVIEYGLMTKEQFAEYKSVFTSITAADMIMQTASALGIGAILTASGVFIMNSVCAKNKFMGAFISAVTASAGGLSAMIPNAIAASVIPLAIGTAAVIFAFRIKDNVTVKHTDKPKDDFLTSIESVKNEDGK